jgi:hypothetical protein
MAERLRQRNVCLEYTFDRLFTSKLQPRSLSTRTGDQRASAVNYANEYEAVIAEPLPARPRGAKENGHEIGPDVFCHRGNSGRLQATKIG